MKLNPDDLVVSTFATDASSIQLPTVGTNNPTPQTYCDDCPVGTIENCW